MFLVILLSFLRLILLVEAVDVELIHHLSNSIQLFEVIWVASNFGTKDLGKLVNLSMPLFDTFDLTDDPSHSSVIFWSIEVLHNTINNFFHLFFGILHQRFSFTKSIFCLVLSRGEGFGLQKIVGNVHRYQRNVFCLGF